MITTVNENIELVKAKLNEIFLTIDVNLDKRVDDGLMGGRAGIALFYFYYSKYIDNQTIYDKGYSLLEQIFESIDKGKFYHSLAKGIVGIGWFVEHLFSQDFLGGYIEDMLNELDEFALEIMSSQIKEGNFDYLHGALGNGLYFLRRFKKNRDVEKYLVKLIDELDKISEVDNEYGLKWASTIKLEKEHKIVYNLSLSHGLASIIVFLSKAYELNLQREKVKRMLNGAVTFLLNNQLDQKKYFSYFPNMSLDSENPKSSRLAWCYGDLGIGIALYQAGKITGDNVWIKKAIEILLHTTERKTYETTFVIDAGLCHGTAGVAHIYNRLYKYTNMNDFKTSSDFWFSETLKMAKFEDGLAGFKVWRTPRMGSWTNETGFLEGVAGIGLALISAISEIEPKWDECLLLS